MTDKAEEEKLPEIWLKFTLREPRGPLIIRLTSIEAFYDQNGHGVLETVSGTFAVVEEADEICELMLGRSLSDKEEHN